MLRLFPHNYAALMLQWPGSLMQLQWYPQSTEHERHPQPAMTQGCMQGPPYTAASRWFDTQQQTRKTIMAGPAYIERKRQALPCP
jgi:hypothetical protein